jgi:hypothetical protein
MLKPILFQFVSLTAASMLQLSCSGDGLVDLNESGKSGSLRNRFDPGGEKPSAFDFEKECGISQKQLDDKNAVLLSGSYTSFPIIVEGKKPVAYRVILQAAVNISATSKGSTLNQKISKVKSAEVGGTGNLIFDLPLKAIVDGIASGKATDASGTTFTESLPITEWLKISGPNGVPEMKDLLCAVTGAKSAVANRGEGTLSATFTPALISSVSPLAPPERMRKEIGPGGRKFNVTANVTSIPQNASSAFKLGSKSGTISIREVNPTISVVNQAAEINSTITADIAWEVTNEFPGGAYTVGLPKTMTFLIDTTKKQIRAIKIFDDRPDAMSGEILTPPVVLVKDK